ncbi:MAG TPA: hypothetical protein VLA00_00165 [Xanthobacteraceae bacterium]|nr:hypothetical protein [Xanthobacteraceae bacterium]
MYERSLSERSFLPGPRASNLVIGLGLTAFAWAIYMRYAVLEPSAIGLACDAGLNTGTCAARRVTQFLFQNSVFGIIALAAAAVQLLRPSATAFTVGVTAAALGVVLYNNNTAALAAGLLLVSLARPAPAR